MSDSISRNMRYIQDLFLDAERRLQNKRDLEDIIQLLDAEVPTYRSIGYEGASYLLAYQDLAETGKLDRWRIFHKRAGLQHPFHIDIGLGWAYAKLRMNPLGQTGPIQRLQDRMILDGIGYYFALFRGRRTLKQHQIPPIIPPEQWSAFNQGIGRRIWYTAQGDIERCLHLLRSFPSSRHPALWRGIGLACGYVGGADHGTLAQLVQEAAEHKTQFKTGIALAAISRDASRSINDSTQLACQVVCEQTVDTIIRLPMELSGQSSLSFTADLSDYIPQFDTFFT